MRKIRIPLITTSLIILLLSLTGCSFIDNITTKVGKNNLDFEFMNEGKVDSIVIQSTRDKGFRFLVNDKDVINSIYRMLSKAEEVNSKTELEPDYIFELHMGSDIKSFYYVTGSNESGEGNFYDDEKIYKLSKRLDNDLIQNLSFLRKPRSFEKIYYDSILKVLSENKALLNQGEAKVGIDILGDTDMTKYQLSVDVEQFEKKLKSIIPNASIMNHNREDFDIIVSVKNYGHKTTVYKSTVTIENKIDNSENKFYIDGTYDKDWEIEIYDSFPKDKWK